MPYIAIKGYPKDEETVKKAVEEIKEVMLRVWGCPQQVLSISYEAVPPEEWQERVRRQEIEAKPENMMILDGEKKY